MKRLCFVVEGYTEEEFIRETLLSYLNIQGIYDVFATKIETSRGHKGGFVNYEHLKRDVIKRLREPNLVVTTFVDYFRIPTSLPDYVHCHSIPIADIDQRIACLEKAIHADIDRHPCFIPYIQKYEFETLLFSSRRGLEEFYGDCPSCLEQFEQIVTAFPNPEEINGGIHTAPSKRLLKLLPDYNKREDGNILALEIGINAMLEKCPRFAAWIQRLVEACCK